MITPSVPCFYLVNAVDEAAVAIAATVTSKSMSDISAMTVLSSQFDNDIAPITEVDAACEVLKSAIATEDFSKSEVFNPLFYPSTDEAFDEALDVEMRNNFVKFIGMEGNPFVAKSTTFFIGSKQVLSSSVNYQQFDLPEYDVLTERRNRPLN